MTEHACDNCDTMFVCPDDCDCGPRPLCDSCEYDRNADWDQFDDGGEY